MRHILIGDVHGLKTELVHLLDQVQPGPRDHIIFVGDLVDKGPDPVGVIRLVRTLAEDHTVVVVEGNHEDTHRRYRRNRRERPRVAAQQAAQKPELQTLTEQLSLEDQAFLDNAVPFHRIPEHNLLVVHAGIPGTMRSFPESVEHARQLTGRARRAFSTIQRTRYLDRDTGRMLPFGEEGRDDPFWADVWDGRFGHVVFGHHPFMKGVAHFPHATGIDTGAVYGGHLTAMVVDADRPPQFFIARGRACAAVTVHETHRNPASTAQPDAAVTAIIQPGTPLC